MSWKCAYRLSCEEGGGYILRGKGIGPITKESHKNYRTVERTRPAMCATWRNAQNLSSAILQKTLVLAVIYLSLAFLLKHLQKYNILSTLLIIYLLHR